MLLSLFLLNAKQTPNRPFLSRYLPPSNPGAISFG
jgi:hypothetical protein